MCIAKLVITGHNRIINHQRSMIGDFAFHTNLGWSGSAMVLGKLPVTGRPTILMIVGQGPAALAVSAGGVVLTFLLSSILSPLPPSLWETDRYRLNYCLKGPLNSVTSTLDCCLKMYGLIEYQVSNYCLLPAVTTHR